MRDKKLVASIREAIIASGLKDGMTISFHHHMRNGDYVLNMVMDEMAALGFKDLTLNATALFDIHLPLIETALGLENAFQIAAASKRVAALFLGAEDLTADLRCKRTKESEEIAYAYEVMDAIAEA